MNDKILDELMKDVSLVRMSARRVQQLTKGVAYSPEDLNKVYIHYNELMERADKMCGDLMKVFEYYEPIAHLAKIVHEVFYNSPEDYEDSEEYGDEYVDLSYQLRDDAEEYEG